MTQRILILIGAVTVAAAPAPTAAQGTRLLRQPTVSATQIAFTYGGDLWIAPREGGDARRLTSTPAVEATPQLSPDGRWLAFTSNRGGNNDAPGGDYFPWAFRQLKVGPLIDGGTITAPSSAVFGLNGDWPAEGEGIPPDIEVPLDAKSVAAGRDPQLERGIAEALKLLQQSNLKPLTLPPASKRARWPAP